MEMEEHVVLIGNKKMEEKKVEMNSSQGCTSSVKAFWTRSAWLRTILGIFMVDVVLYLYDIISDILVVVDLYQRSHTFLFLTSLTFVILPFVVTMFWNLSINIMIDLNKTLWQLRFQDFTSKHFVEVLPMITPLYAVYLGFLRMKNQTKYTKEHIRIKATELFLEAGPQLVLQIYIVTTLPLTSFYVYFGSILTSFLSAYIGWTKNVLVYTIDLNHKSKINSNEMSVHQRLTGQIIREPTLMEMLRCSLIFTLWDTLLFFFLALIIIPPFPLIGHIIVYSVIGISVIINNPGSPYVILTIEKRLILKSFFNFVCILILSTILLLLQEPSENCTIGHNTCLYPKLSARVDVNVTFCPYELNATFIDNNCSWKNYFFLVGNFDKTWPR